MTGITCRSRRFVRRAIQIPMTQRAFELRPTVIAACALLVAVTACSDGGNTPSGTNGGASGKAGSAGSPAGGISNGGSSPIGTAGTTEPTAGSGGATAGAGTGGGGATAGSAAGGASGSGGVGGGQPSQGGTGGGGGAGGGGAGPGGYNPCPTDGAPCLILPLGDSITDGVGSSNQAGYRAPLFELIVDAQQKVNFVGSRSGGPDQVAGQQFPRKHEGHPGWTIDSGYVSFGDGISTLIPTPAFSTVPHIVLLMIGTNDVSATMGTDMIAERLDRLLDKVVQAAPKALVVVATITPISWNPAAATNYNAKIPGLVQARAGKGQHLVTVDMSKMPAANLASDGLHPNDGGYAFMAGVWYAAIEDFLPKE